ncbi:MAG: DUF6515 family protein [Pseudomonadota bacterium]
MTKYCAPSVAIAIAVTLAVATVILPADTQAQDREPYKAEARAPHRSVQHPQVGHRVRTLPQGHRTIRVNRQSYRYHNGSFYRPGRDGVYVVVRAPIGARIGTLPPGYVSFGIGPRRYFYANFTYYLRDRDRTEYIVVEEPEGAEAALVTASETTSAEIFVYPNQGQSDEQRNRDRYECYLWASEQTGHDPGAGNPDMEKAGDYRRAISACLEGRGYTVK